jgi:alkylated DNA repair protein alkB family protein 8
VYIPKIDRHLLIEFVKHIPNNSNEEIIIQDPNKISKLIPGLSITLDFISIKEEEKLINDIYNDDRDWFELSKRRIKHFGLNLNYDQLKLESCPFDIPIFYHELTNRYNSLFNDNFNLTQVTVNEYPAGSGIPSHIDEINEFGSHILIISTQAEIIMEFKQNHNIYHVLLPQRSLCVVKDEARYQWEHGIRPRKIDIINGLARYRKTRLSFTFRDKK